MNAQEAVLDVPVARKAASSSQTVFALTIFVSAFLLFQVQLIVAKQLLPWFGGSAGVWNTCLVFFQLLFATVDPHSHRLAGWFCDVAGNLRAEVALAHLSKRHSAPRGCDISGVAYSGFVIGERRTAFLPVVDHRTFVAGLVHPRAPRRVALQVVRPLQSGIVARAADLSLAV